MGKTGARINTDGFSIILNSNGIRSVLITKLTQLGISRSLTMPLGMIDSFINRIRFTSIDFFLKDIQFILFFFPISYLLSFFPPHLRVWGWCYRKHWKHISSSPHFFFESRVPLNTRKLTRIFIYDKIFNVFPLLKVSF